MTHRGGIQYMFAGGGAGRGTDGRKEGGRRKEGRECSMCRIVRNSLWQEVRVKREETAERVSGTPRRAWFNDW